jgi:type I site-specific restriction endonuclease
MTAPTPKDVICDPACGTAGFLIAASEHLVQHHSRAIYKEDGQALLTRLLARSEAPSLAHFVRNLVGMDRAAAQEAFSGFLSNRSLTTPQIRFIEMVIDQLTAHGVMETSALYEAQFSSVHHLAVQ